MECWKSIKKYNDLYEISDEGRVKSLRTGRILCGKINSSGYLQYVFSVNGVEKKFYAHRLVAEAFIPNDEHLTEVNHIDGNKLNNNVSNLEWCSRRKNYEHAVKNGLIKRIQSGKFSKVNLD